MATYYKNKNQVKLKPVETLGYTAGKGYYADGQPACTGVIIDRSQILTAGHCVMSGGDDGGSATPLPASDFAVEAGVSDYKEPLKSDHPQFRSVFAVRAMPGYIGSSRRTLRNYLDAVAHDLTVLMLSRPLDLDRDDARAAYLQSARTPCLAVCRSL